ncbi:MAG: hypothetical protein MPEBLZ_04260 [Candidatus Methanoperedens nitroreducens]|uniref:Uncharacterized protein n=1 Tax=Candidatus Methanoperedens nitratireducens TaxID=1392998 RepID=A0A0P7ZCL7_9EURY|nr:hypothetical protein [Candidatus Methanoperedens sp. BLZ2]KAB2942412.1 MAG: hypothetical protein F9K14_17330 [Candidatus Methanoperedens sp.]KPQ41204.1 MAG: hypothetical protein MPEBLZ_04260 [Candidatus Methanoperedens sp. BLZ1]MBZ0176647.1 hypothetical protein [Candidatus Methanoperedens nitroreducens]MCX9080371.1 hypothetical protein [Candidatus Methanoperedens sp.]
MGMNFRRIGTFVKEKINKKIVEFKEEQKFKQELDERLKQERRTAALNNTSKIAKIEADRKLQEIRSGKQQSGGILNGIRDWNDSMNQQAQNDLSNMFGGGSGANKKSQGGIFSGFGVSDADRRMLGMPSAKKEPSASHKSNKKKHRGGGTTIIIRK